MLVNKIIPGLYNGISQQPASLRLDTQSDSEENCSSSIATGLSKRSPTEHLAILTSKASTDSFMHIINRDSTERYILLLTGDADEPLEVYTMAGVKCTLVTTEAGLAYLASNSPRLDFRATTAADYTLIANTKKKCLMSATIDPLDQPTAIINVAKGVAGQSYNVYLNGTRSATYASGGTTEYESYKTSVIANSLHDQLAALATNQLAVNLAGEPIQGATIRISLDGTYIGDAVTAIFDAVEETFVYNPTTTAAAVYAELLAHINTAAWGVFLVGTMIYIKKYGYNTFTYVVTATSYSAGPTVTPPGTSSSWDIDFKEGTNVIRVRKIDGTDFTFSTSDTYGNTALIGVKGTTQKFDNLPVECFDGFRVEITGEPTNQFDSYHLKYDTSLGTTSGVWKEVPKQGISHTFDASTLPHQLTRTATNTFTLAPVAWLARRVGDAASCPSPSFIDSYVNDIFFYRNRLGILAGENVVLSQAGEFFDFWPTTATAVLDADPIDISCPSDEVTELVHAVPFPKSLYLVGAQQQFSLNSGQLTLTAKTVAVDICTHFEVDTQCQPVVAGPNVYLPVPKGDYSSLREYFISSDSYSTDAADVTAHVPQYLPKNLSKLSASSAFDMMVALSPDDPGAVYVYRYYWNGDTKVQSAWSRWTVSGAVINGDILSNYLYLVVKRGAEVSLERIRLDDASTGTILPFRVHLDRLIKLTGVYNAGTGRTTWTLPYADSSPLFSVVREDTGFLITNATKATDSAITALGNFSSFACWIGRQYTMRYRFSEWVIKAPSTNVGVLQGRLQVRCLTLGMIETGEFTIEVTPPGRDRGVVSHFNATVGISVIGMLPLSEGEFRSLIMTRSTGAVVELVNDTYLPSRFHTASFEGFFTIRSKSL